MIQITQVNDLGNDVLEVNGFDDSDPTTSLTATGWISATTNFYPSNQYDKTGNLIQGATKRAMTPSEQQVYWLSLLEPQSPAAATPTVLYSDAKAIATQDKAVATQEAIAAQPVDTTTQPIVGA